MSDTVFRKIIIPGVVLDDGSFSFSDFKKIIVEIPKEFVSAVWGYGTYYGRFYGHT